MKIRTPYYRIDIDKLKANIDGPIRRLREEADCKVFIALKGFSVEPVLSMISYGLDGASASGLYESRLGKTAVRKEVHTFSPGFKDDEIEEIAENSTAVIFNSENQYDRYCKTVYEHNASCAIRLNPEYSTLPESFAADPCRKFSRLGVPCGCAIDPEKFGEGKIEGIHIHTMCEQNAEILEQNIDLLIKKYDKYLRCIKWINLGGGQLFAKDGYCLDRAISALNRLHERYDFEIILEPCTGIVTDCAKFVTTVIDIIHNGMDIAIIDGSAVCHIPDTAYIGWKREIEGASLSDDLRYIYSIAGCSCYSADVWGDYSFDKPLRIGDQIVFKDAAMYSIVKGNFFNGLIMPSIVLYSEKEGLKVVKEYNYNHFLAVQ